MSVASFASGVGPVRSAPPKYRPREAALVPHRVAKTDPDGVDYGRVMQLTFVVTIVAGAPVVALASVPYELPTWAARAAFAVRAGAVVWFVTAVGAYLYERRRVRGADSVDPDATDLD